MEASAAQTHRSSACAVLVLALVLTGPVGRAADAWSLAVKGASYDEECLTYCLQGLVNRDAPRLFLDTASIFWSCRASDSFWLKYLQDRKGFRFTQLASLREAIQHFRPEVKGVVLYDPSHDASRYVALTLAAQRSLLPVTAAMLAYETPALRDRASSTAVPALECFAGLPVVEDLRGRFADDLAATRWALDNLFASCTRKLTFSAGHTHDDTALGGDPAITIGLDYPIAQKAFIFNLTPMSGPFSLGGHEHPGHADQAALFDEVMQKLDRPAGVYGWAEPEAGYCDRVSRSGNFVICAGAPNLSFWAKVSSADAVPRLPSHVTPGKPLEAKYYLTFQANEGDTPKILAALQNGAWMDERRGSVPIAWGVNPYLAEHFPALFEFYAREAKPNDTFFAGCSGGGYCYPWLLPNQDDYFRHVGKLIREHGPNVVDVWQNGLRKDLYQRYHDLAKPDCFTQQTTGPAFNDWLDDGTPILSAANSLYYFELKPDDAVGDLQRRIEAVATAHEQPFFILAYGGCGPGLLGLVQEMQRRLPQDRFEVVGMQDLAALAREAGRFSVAFAGLGVSPGGTIKLTTTLRNPDGKSGAAGAVTWRLPAGWQATTPGWEHGPVLPGQALHHELTLTVGSPGGAARLLCTDSRTGQQRSALVNVYTATEVISDFSTPAGWEGKGATLTVQDGLGRITTPGPFAAVRRWVAIDFDRGPLLEAYVPAVEGAWALKLNDGTLPVDISIQGDASLTGRQTYDLSILTGWTGTKRVELILFAIGAGTSVTVDEVLLHYRQ